MVSQPDQQVIDLLIATEERLVLLPLDRPEARVGIVGNVRKIRSSLTQLLQDFAQKAVERLI